MPDDQEIPPYPAHTPVPVDPVVAEWPVVDAPLAPRVRWGRAAVLQVGAGGIAGFVVPNLFQYDPRGALALMFASPSNFVIISIVLLISAVLVGLFGGGIPLLAAWGSWFIVSRRRRDLGREVLAVVLGSIAGGLVASLPAIVILALLGAPWPFFAVPVFVFGGIPAPAFALWVVGAWRRARREAISTHTGV